MENKAIRCVPIDGNNRVRFIKDRLAHDVNFMTEIGYMIQELDSAPIDFVPGVDILNKENDSEEVQEIEETESKKPKRSYNRKK